MTLAARTSWISRARDLGPALAESSGQHDAEGTFVEEAYASLREQGFFSALVPVELGGSGAALGEMCEAIRELAYHCPATALSFSMHSHLVAAAVWRWLHVGAGEALLRRIVDEELVLVSTGATDWVDSNGEMRKVDGGYRVDARKVFASGSPGAHALITSARLDGAVLHFSVPFTAEGVQILEDWDTLGMRGTGSNTVLFDNVFVPEDAVTLERSQGQWHPAWTVAVTVALPILMSPYVAIAERSAQLALADARGRAGEPWMQLLAGELRNALMATQVTWREMIRNAAEYDFEPTVERADAALAGKTLCTQSALATVQKAMEVSGGRGYFRRHELQRLLRDAHAAPYHPLPEKKQQLFSGRIALGLDPIRGCPTDGNGADRSQSTDRNGSPEASSRKEPEMPRYLIELAHDDEHAACVRALQAVEQYGSHLVTHANWGCEQGVHAGYLIAEADSREAALQLVPPQFRREVRIVEVKNFSREDIRGMVAALERSRA